MFAFSQVDPRTNGNVSDMEVPIGRYLQSSFEQGQEDSMFSNISKMHELSLAESDPDARVLSPEEANNRYSLPGLKWDRPVKENVAQVLNRRQQAELDRQFFLSQDNHNVAAGLAGMGASMAGSVLNPLDLGTLFMPIVGEESFMAKSANVLGRGILKTGLISRSALEEAIPAAPRLAESVIQGVGYQAMQEGVGIANRLSEGKGSANISDVENIGLGALMAGGLHLSLRAASRLFKSLDPVTWEAMSKQALDDFVKGDQISVSDLAKLENEKVVEAAIKDNEGVIHTASTPGMPHASIMDELKETDYRSPTTGRWPGFDEKNFGFLTNKGRFVDRDEAARLSGFSEPMHATDLSEDADFEKEIREAEEEEAARIINEQLSKTSQASPSIERENQKILAATQPELKAKIDEAKVPAEPQDPDVARVVKDAKELHDQIKDDPKLVQALDDIGMTKDELDNVFSELGMNEEEEVPWKRGRPRGAKNKPKAEVAPEPPKPEDNPIVASPAAEPPPVVVPESRAPEPAPAPEPPPAEPVRPVKPEFRPTAVAMKNLRTGEITRGEPGQIHAQLLKDTGEKLVDQQARIARITKQVNEHYTEAYDILEKWNHEDPDAAITQMEQNPDHILERYQNKDEEDLATLDDAVKRFAKQKEQLARAREVEDELKRGPNMEPGFVNEYGDYMSKDKYQEQLDEAIKPYRNGPSTPSIEQAADCLLKNVV